ncbi:hypothetical protein CC78DRAFT_483646, partial [Lojkania enalia]
LPSRFALRLATFFEWVYCIFTLGTKGPYYLGKQQVRHAWVTHTDSIEKARKMSGYEPKDNFESDLEKSAEWCLYESGWKRKLEGIKNDMRAEVLDIVTLA